MPLSRTGGTLLYASLPLGLPCWVELDSTDPSAAVDFYGSLFDWRFQPRTAQEAGDHHVATIDGIPVGAVSGRQAAASGWVLHLAAQHLDDTVATARRLGADVLRDRQALGSIGERVVLRDTGLAEVALLRAGHDWHFEVGRPGSLLWAELITDRVRHADHFYETLFEYDVRQFGDGRRSDFVVWYVRGDSVLARVRMIRDTSPPTEPHWLVYFGVDPALGVDETVSFARSLGGEVRVEPFDSSYGRVAVLRDVTGARFGLIDPTQATAYESAAIYDPHDD